MLETEKIEFKGTKNGLVINIRSDCDYKTAKELIGQKVKGAKGFFDGARIYAINCSGIDDVEYIMLKEYIEGELGMQIVEEERQLAIEYIPSGDTKFIRSTLRSGKRVEFSGNIVIIGDVNPGAHIIADGNVVVIGALRGVVHAGADGNREAFVVANNLEPMQLRIADLIAIPPDEGHYEKPDIPEIAFIKENYIIIEPCLNRK